MELLNVYELPLSNDEEIKTAQIKILNKEELTTREKVILGRDHTVKEVLGYKLKPDHAYRVVSKDTLDLYLESGYVFSYEVMNIKNMKKMEKYTTTIKELIGI